VTVDGRTPVVVVTGFLGSGKTTLVNRLLKREPESLVIVNEFGEVPVDHLLVESSSEKAVALPNGCLCCHLRGDLEETLIGAAMRRRRGEIAGFDRVIVETSGLADPGPVAQTLYADAALARDFKLGPIVTVVDAADAAARSFSPEIARGQIAAADLVILSKVDRAANTAEAEAEVRELNPGVRCISARYGEVDPKTIFEAQPASGLAAFRPVAHSGAIRSFALKFDAPVPRTLLEHFIATLVELRGADLLRVKGVVPLREGGSVLVQGVRHVFDRLRPVERGEPALVFVTHRIDKAEIEALWQAMTRLFSHVSRSSR
jgi:G3E family GTPase